MPETNAERVISALGLVAIVALAILVVHWWPGKSSPHAAPGVHSRSTAAVTTTAPYRPPVATTPARLRRTGTVAGTTTTHATTTGPRPVRLVLTAATGDSWVEVRDGSSTGAVLFSGILASGSTKAFSATKLWARFGSAGNVHATLDGHAVSLPGGTYGAVFGRSGFTQVAA